jgi:LytS/YehU family sensor histidine kinase
MSQIISQEEIDKLTSYIMITKCYFNDRINLSMEIH